jgi:hypothetical protein
MSQHSHNNNKEILDHIAIFIGRAYQEGKKDIVFRFIIEYSSLRDFYRPLGNNNRSIYFYMRIF